jgi:hypothetical protein
MKEKKIIKRRDDERDEREEIQNRTIFPFSIERQIHMKASKSSLWNF